MRYRRCEAITHTGERCKRAWQRSGSRALCRQHSKMWNAGKVFARKITVKYVGVE